MTDKEHERVAIGQLSTGVPGLDEVVGGGLPEYSFNLLAGAPGTGKTTLAQQILFANATSERPALYFTVLGEPPVKMLRYQQQYSFFDFDMVDSAIRFRNLSGEVLEHGLERVLETISREVEEHEPGLVVVDSFRTVVRASATARGGQNPEVVMQGFMQRLALQLTSWEVTSFLVGEYLESERRDNPVFTVADGIVWLYQTKDGNSVVRKLQAMKMRGQAPVPGIHTFRITDDGLQVFPRVIEVAPERRLERAGKRISTGVAELDEMMDGGIPQGDAVVVAGSSGTGKSLLCTEFTANAIENGEAVVFAAFEENPDAFIRRGRQLGVDMEEAQRRGQLEIIYLRPLDLSADETMLKVQDAVNELGASRVVIDSLSGFEIALAPTFRDQLRESLYRMIRPLTQGGITSMLTMETVPDYAQLRFTPEHISFLADDIILQLQVEIDGEYCKVINVIKMRSSAHSHDLRIYDITSDGMDMGEVLDEYRGVITGVPMLTGGGGGRMTPWNQGTGAPDAPGDAA